MYLKQVYLKQVYLKQVYLKQVYLKHVYLKHVACEKYIYLLFFLLLWAFNTLFFQSNVVYNVLLLPSG